MKKLVGFLPKWGSRGNVKYGRMPHLKLLNDNVIVLINYNQYFKLSNQLTFFFARSKIVFYAIQYNG